MDKQEIIEGNKLISDFMGLRPLEWKNSMDGSDMLIWVDKINGITVHDDPELQYHSSFDWLMPVVEKIEALNRGSIQFYIKDTRAYLEQDTQTSMAFDLPDLPPCYSGFCDSKILAVYSTVIQFIKYYNSQNKPQ